MRHQCISQDCCVFVNPSLQCGYKENIRRSSCIINASRMFVVFCKRILAMVLQRKHQTIISHILLCYVRSIASITHVSLCFVNPFLKCCYKENVWLAVIARMHHACLLCFVNPSLQYCYKENIRRSSMHHACSLCFVNPSLQYCYKENIRQSSMHLFVVFCKPILAMLLQRKCQTIIMHLACFRVCCVLHTHRNVWSIARMAHLACCGVL